jgi:hypothetical protein
MITRRAFAESAVCGLVGSVLGFENGVLKLNLQ